MNPDPLDILRSAVTDVGYWSWWTSDFPKYFQLEFGGIQLKTQPLRPGQAPPGQVALSFGNLISVSFLTRRSSNRAPPDIPRDWPEQLHRDKFHPLPHLSPAHGNFEFAPSAVEPALGEAGRIDTIFGPAPLEVLSSTPPVTFVVWAGGGVGAAVLAGTMKVLTHAGELALTDIREAHRQWWAYWREYWNRKDSNDPMSKDYACEVTIPMKGSLGDSGSSRTGR